jgi:hypothetical protein
VEPKGAAAAACAVDVWSCGGLEVESRRVAVKPPGAGLLPVPPAARHD